MVTRALKGVDTRPPRYVMEDEMTVDEFARRLAKSLETSGMDLIEQVKDGKVSLDSSP